MPTEALEARLETTKHVVGYVCRVYVIGRAPRPSEPLHVYCCNWQETEEKATAKARAWAEGKGYEIAD